MPTKGPDYLIELGLDTSKLEKQYPKVFKNIEKHAKAVNKVERDSLALKNKSLALAQKNISLAKRQATLEKQIRASEAKGGKGFGNIRKLAGNGDQLSIAKAELALKEKLLVVDKKLAKQSEKKAKGAAQEKEKLSLIKSEIAAHAENTRRLKAQQKTQESIIKAEIAAYAENERRQRRLNKQPKAPVDPTLISARSRATFSASLDAAANKPYIVSGKFKQDVQNSKEQIRGLQKELDGAKTLKDLARIRSRFSEIQNTIRQTTSEQRRFNRELEKGNKVTTKISDSFKGFALSFASAYAAINAGKAIFRIGKEFDGMRAGLLAASDSAVAATENFQFLLDTSKRLGTDLESGARGFNRLGVAMKGAGFSAEEIKEVYSAAQESTATFQLSAEKSNLVMFAFSQIASKAAVSSEELQRQLGDNLPITMKAAEMATGKTSEEVLKMMKRGELMSRDFLLPFARAQREIVRQNQALQKATEKLTSQQHRMNTAFKEMVDGVFQKGGAAGFFTSMFKAITKGIEVSKPFIVSISRLFFDMGSMAVEATSAVAELIGALLSFGKGPKDGSKSGWYRFGQGLIAIFSALSSVIWEAIAGIHVLKDLVTFDSGGGNAQAANLGGNMTSRWQAAILSNLVGRATGNSGNSSNVKIDKIEVNSNATDTKQVAYDVMAMFNSELGFSQ